MFIHSRKLVFSAARDFCSFLSFLSKLLHWDVPIEFSTALVSGQQFIGIVHSFLHHYCFIFTTMTWSAGSASSSFEYFLFSSMISGDELLLEWPSAQVASATEDVYCSASGHLNAFYLLFCHYSDQNSVTC